MSEAHLIDAAARVAGVELGALSVVRSGRNAAFLDMGSPAARDRVLAFINESRVQERARLEREEGGAASVVSAAVDLVPVSHVVRLVVEDQGRADPQLRRTLWRHGLVEGTQLAALDVCTYAQFLASHAEVFGHVCDWEVAESAVPE